MRDVAGLKAVAAERENLIVVPQIFVRQRQEGLGLQHLHERPAHGEKQRTLEIGLRRHRNGRRVDRAVPPELALVLPFVKVAHGGAERRARERVAAVVIADLIQCDRPQRIRPQIGRDLGRSRFVDANSSCLKRRIRCLESIPNLRPGQCGLRKPARSERAGQNTTDATTPHEAHVVSFANDVHADRRQAAK